MVEKAREILECFVLSSCHGMPCEQMSRVSLYLCAVAAEYKQHLHMPGSGIDFIVNSAVTYFPLRVCSALSRKRRWARLRAQVYEAKGEEGRAGGASNTPSMSCDLVNRFHLQAGNREGGVL